MSTVATPEIPQSQCSSIGQAVWVNVHSYSFCIRYFLSTAGGGTGKPIVFLQGDQLGRLDGRTNNFNPPPATRDTDTSKLLNFADGLSKAAKSPAIYDARRRRLRYGHITGLEKRIANMLACHGIASCAGLRA